MQHHSPASLTQVLAPAFAHVNHATEDHLTPNGTPQRFTYARFRRCCWPMLLGWQDGPSTVARAGGLGLSGLRLAVALVRADEAMSLGELAAFTGLSTRTVRRHLPVLVVAGADGREEEPEPRRSDAEVVLGEHDE